MASCSGICVTMLSSPAPERQWRRVVALHPCPSPPTRWDLSKYPQGGAFQDGGAHGGGVTCCRTTKKNRFYLG
ncbi:hypothetical protein Y1Q_0017498 [Alligator mississippiensis]|uniref:Uncharacterized protein n=1 Tax=Alligator mississippiensis TaxID=8496 RepID=A0A151P2N5_ALLMI|nr:hypothetical protein Y1Q_0017498 [Alligator mississippiensis]